MVSLTRVLLFGALSAFLLLAEYNINGIIKEASWLGHGIKEFPLRAFTTQDFTRMIEHIDVPTVRLYAAFQIVDCLFAFAAGMLLCDIITMLLDCVIPQSSFVRWLDVTPFLLVIADFAENLALLFLTIFWPAKGNLRFLLPLASRLSYVKLGCAVFVGISISITVVIFIIVGSIKLFTRPEPKIKKS